MKLIPVNPHDEDHIQVLYALLAERRPEAMISHKVMPTMAEHREFVWRSGLQAKGLAYEDWWLIEVDAEIAGSVYRTERNEIGIAVFQRHQGRGIGSAAIAALMQRCGKRPYLANINPGNEASRKMFEKLGFKLIQHTYALEVL